jgi:hypothetical protein
MLSCDKKQDQTMEMIVNPFVLSYAYMLKYARLFFQTENESALSANTAVMISSWGWTTG